MASNSGFSYPSIRPTEQIRLLTLLPTGPYTNDDESVYIRCYLDVYHRDALPKYEALSYTWGGEARTRSVVCNGKPFPVTENCYKALKALGVRCFKLSKPLSLPKLWIDAVCINQDDNEERSGQVAIMGAIFHSAALTVVHLGDLLDGPGAASSMFDVYALRAVDTLHRLSHLTIEHDLDFTDLREVLRNVEDFPVVWKLFFAQSWFTRMWVVQEVLLADRVLVLWGQHSFPWRCVELFATLPSQLMRWTKLLGDSDFRIVNEYRERRLISPLVANPPAVHWPIPWSRTREHHVSEMTSDDTGMQVAFSYCPEAGHVAHSAARTLFDLLESSCKLRCRDPRDKLFALLALFERNAPSEIAVDYSRSTADVYRSLSWWLISHGVLEILSLKTNSPKDATGPYPSWTVDWTLEHADRLSFDVSIPTEVAANPPTSTVVKRTGDTLILRGRLLEDSISHTFPVRSVYHYIRKDYDPELYKDFSTRSGIKGLGTAHLQPGDIPCLFHGYNMPLLLRVHSYDESGRFNWQLVGECWLDYDKWSHECPGYDMDWSKTFPHISQSPEQDIWLC